MQAGYRADIDGLRSIAILPVLLFHAGVPGFAGGYVGVDVFFVISGYLITGIIAREIDEGRFSIIGFYERRARRIMPALMVMIAAAVAASAWLYLPTDFRDVPGSAIAATLFLSNAWFFTHTGYFAGGAETMPLLHTWSLAVEEQYYIVFPLLLMGIARFAPRLRLPVIAACAIISFALAWFTQARGDGIAFYLSPPRAWELLAGSLLALGAVPVGRIRALREVIAWAGIAAIGYAVFTFTKTTIFPGVTALFPVIGAAAVIHSAPGTTAARVLSFPLLVGTGLISYSLYLWHWPVIVFVQYATDARLTGWTSVAVIAGSIALATLSWRFIEQPFRDRRQVDRKTIFRITGAAMAAACLICGLLATTRGWPARFPVDVARMDAAHEAFSPLRKTCHDTDPARGKMPCTLGNPAAPDAVMWGDSHGVELAYAIARLPSRQGHGLVEHTRSSCPPIVGIEMASNPRCKPNNDEVMTAIRADKRLKTVYMICFWAEHGREGSRFWSQLDATIAALVADGRRVIIFAAVPPNGIDVPRYLARLARDGRLDQAPGMPRAAVAKATVKLRAILDRWRTRGVTVIDPADALCGPERCSIIRDGKVLYFDSHHLSVDGATLVAQLLEHVPPTH